MNGRAQQRNETSRRKSSHTRAPCRRPKHAFVIRDFIRHKTGAPCGPMHIKACMHHAAKKPQDEPPSPLIKPGWPSPSGHPTSLLRFCRPDFIWRESAYCVRSSCRITLTWSKLGTRVGAWLHSSTYKKPNDHPSGEGEIHVLPRSHVGGGSSLRR